MYEKIRNSQGDCLHAAQHTRQFVRSIGLTFLIFALSLMPVPQNGASKTAAASANSAQSVIFLPIIKTQSSPVIHAPFLDTDDVYQNGFNQMAITWFGQINRFSNSSDMRIGFNREKLVIDIASFDRQLAYDTTNPSPNEVNNWDAASLYLRIPASGQRAAQLLRFDGQLSGPENRAAYQAAYRFSGGGWTRADISFITATQWRGGGMNDSPEDRGWAITYEIPFAGLGLSGMPAQMSAWDLGVRVYDRDWNEDNVAISQTWPPSLKDNDPGSYGRITFGYPGYTPPSKPAAGTLTIREGNGITVEDGTVGGYATCGGDMNFWTEWGDRVYNSGDEVENAIVQNQRDVADFPCFARYYVSFPIGQLPKGKVILSAKLTLHHFGNSDPLEARRSYIQVFRVNQPWSESTLSWNSAPIPFENYPGAWVDPLPITHSGPDVPRTWDVTRALVDVYSGSQDMLRLAMYSSDRSYNSGKYFRASESPSWYTPPTLTIQWAEP